MNCIKRIFSLLISLFLSSLPIWVLPVQATLSPPANLLQRTGWSAGYDTVQGSSSLSFTIGLIINASLGLLGTIFLVLLVYAGYEWLTAGGDEEKVTEAKKYIKNSIIGLIIVLAAFGISQFVVSGLLTATIRG